MTASWFFPRQRSRGRDLPPAPLPTLSALSTASFPSAMLLRTFCVESDPSLLNQIRSMDVAATLADQLVLSNVCRLPRSLLPSLGHSQLRCYLTGTANPQEPPPSLQYANFTRRHLTPPLVGCRLAAPKKRGVGRARTRASSRTGRGQEKTARCVEETESEQLAQERRWPQQSESAGGGLKGFTARSASPLPSFLQIAKCRLALS